MNVISQEQKKKLKFFFLSEINIHFYERGNIK